MYWNVGCTSLNDFFCHLLTAEQRTLQLTRDVLDERQKLHALIQGIQQDIRKGMNAIDEMRQEKRVLEINETKIQANKDFTYQAVEYHQKKVPLPFGKYVTNCLLCHHTCHFSYAIPMIQIRGVALPWISMVRPVVIISLFPVAIKMPRVCGRAVIIYYCLKNYYS